MDVYSTALNLLRDDMTKSLTSQNRFNRFIRLFCVASTAVIVTMYNHINSQAKQIKELRVEIEELNNQKGE